MSKRLLALILCIVVPACTAVLDRSSTKEASIQAGAERALRERRLPFEMETDGPCWVLGKYDGDRLERITISIGLSNARLDWMFQLSDGQLHQFVVVRNYFRWNALTGEFDHNTIYHKRSVTYDLRNGKVRKQMPSDEVDLADDEWVPDRIAHVLTLAEGYLASGRRRTFEVQMAKLSGRRGEFRM